MKILLAVEAMTIGANKLAERAHELGYQLRLLAEDPSLYSDLDGVEVVIFPTRDHAALRSYVKGIRDDLGGIFSPTDTWGVIAAELREEFDFPRRHSAAQLRDLRDKQWVRRTLGEVAVDSFPRIIKPRGGTGSTGVTLVHNEDELASALDSVDDVSSYVIEPYYRGSHYSAELWSNGTTTVFFGATNRILTPPPLFLEKVKTFPHEHGTPWEASVEQWAQRILSTLDYRVGFAHLEFIETAAGFELVELNARMPGALITPAIETCTNYDPYALVIADALNRQPQLPERREIIGGHSHVSLYASATGRLTSIDRLPDLKNYPGAPGWVPAKSPGDEVPDISSFRARIGNVYATANSPALAQDRAIAASQVITVEIQ